MHPLIEQHRAAIRALAARHGIENVRVFGSMARGDAGADSDIDLLVSLPPGRSGLALGGLLMDVQDLTHRKVDLVTEASLHPALRDRVLREACSL
ncbi:nucleotidyltransferase family protein [Thioalkalicoccus limnaeus]|uniref:Nucleotidyltransferase family protein n=1 Tax=Thioalkalicoccus limnaeus TaxID=120681 RepID=A0ABV4BHE2_9GAMM